MAAWQPRNPLPAKRAFVAFDSAPATFGAVASCLHGRSYSVSGFASARAAGIAAAATAPLNRIPAAARRRLYALSGHMQTIRASELARVDTDLTAEWFIGQLPKRRYPAVVIGSGGGGVAHLCAALGIPFLPQNSLVALAQPRRHVDDAWAEVELNREKVRRLLKRNPRIVVHQMQDPNQDRLMLSVISYLRCKWAEVPPAYERFLRDALEPGATILVTDCRLSWSTTRVGGRHVFQFGGWGGLEADDYRSQSAPVQEFLRREKSPWPYWSPPPSDEISPEAEWGLEPALLDALARLSEKEGWRLQRLSFPGPDDLSEPVAALYRDWYCGHGVAADRLLVSSFALLDPWTAVRTRAIPFWTSFSVRSAIAPLKAHLDAHDYEEITWTAFPHGMRSIGLADLDAWQRLASRAPRKRSLGLDTRRFPADLAAFARYRAELESLPAPACKPLAPVSLASAREVFSRYPGIEWTGASAR